MADATILILPGLDGTNTMLEQFRQECAGSHRVVVGTLPDDTTLGYDGLAEHFGSIIRKHSACHIIAESFSGPIGILLAKKHPELVTRLTLVASFATSPVPKIASYLPWFLIFRFPIPNFIARYFFVGKCKSLIPVLRNAIRQNSYSILRHRFGLVEHVDVSSEYSQLNCDLTYIRPTSDRLVPQRCLDKILDDNPATVVHNLEGPYLILETQPENSWRKIAG